MSVNKGAWDRAETFEQIHRFNLQWLRECRRVLKPNGTLWVTGTAHNIFSVGFALPNTGLQNTQRHRLVQGESAAQFIMPLLHPCYGNDIMGAA